MTEGKVEMEQRFYERHAGATQVKEIYNTARERTEDFRHILDEYTRFQLASERLAELQVQLDEQTKAVEELRQEMEVARTKDLNGSFSALQSQYSIERDARDELNRCVKVLKAIREPELPEWLSVFIRDVSGVNGNGKR